VADVRDLEDRNIMIHGYTYVGGIDGHHMYTVLYNTASNHDHIEQYRWRTRGQENVPLLVNNA